MTRRGFFATDELAKKAPPSLFPQCGACGLFKHCQSPKMKPYGKGEWGILIVGEASGKTEDREGRPFVGETGQLLNRTLAKLGVDMDRDCWRTNALICRPHTEKNENRPPTDKEIEFCRPNLINTIKELNPTTIIPLGGAAVTSLIGWVWKDDGGVGAVGRWRGWDIPCQKLNAWICPTWHPSFVIREEGYGESGKKHNEVRSAIWEADLKQAVRHSKRPWQDIPDYESMVRCVYDPAEAAKRIRELVAAGKPLAFDYETTTLKPDSEHSRIVCCSISDGTVSYAYPWHGEAIRATKEFLLSNLPKIGWNAKFEERWSLKEFGHGITNWLWDGVLASHVIDNREQIGSLEFQAFVNLGVSTHKDIKPYLKAPTANALNRITEVSLPKLLKYCGFDSLFEHHVAVKQMKELKRKERLYAIQ